MSDTKPPEISPIFESELKALNKRLGRIHGRLFFVGGRLIHWFPAEFYEEVAKFERDHNIVIKGIAGPE